MADFLFAPVSHDEAVDFIASKPVVSREVFNRLLPELRPRAFTITGVDAASAVQAIRDRIADLPAGSTWDAVKKDIARQISPHFIDADADAEDRDKQINASNRRAELLLRTHGFQAYQTASFDRMSEQKDVLPYWQYVSMGDGRVRPSHAALNGVVLPAVSPFWNTHFPPWDFGCRCQAVPLSKEDHDDIKAADASKGPDQQRVIEGPTLKELELNNRLFRGPNQIANVSPPSGPAAYHWHPGDRDLSVADLRSRYDVDVFEDFEKWAKQTKISSRQTVWQWVDKVKGTPAPAPAPVAPGTPTAPAKPVLPAVPFKDEIVWQTSKPEPGTLNGVDFAPVAKNWWDTVKDVDIGEPKPLSPIKRAGVLIREPDGRVWIVQPTNQFGNRKHTWPGGGVEKGLTIQQNALKEVWEETGLQVKITGHIGDFRDSNNSNNGRLYVGERIGGAPWDAKVESFIKDNKTGKPAAESETVSLVTLDRAAALLHRTDDLAQLAAIRPIPLATPVRGRGSETLKKLVEAILPAARDYERKQTAATRDPGNAELHAVQELRGYNAPPTVLPKAAFDALMAKGGHVEMLRGISSHGAATAKDFFQDLKQANHYPGYGIFGSGTYADSNGRKTGQPNVAVGSYSGARGVVARLALPKTAKVIDVDELERLVPDKPDLFKGYAGQGGKIPKECWMGVQAALAGYDAIYINGRSRRYGSYGKGFYVVLNRSILTVQDNPVPRTYVIP